MKSSYKEIRLDPEKVRELYKKALGAAANNMRTLTCFPRPVLTTGPGYTGIWQEHNHDSLLYADYDMEAAVASHDIFYAFQREDGLMPAMIHYDRETLASAPVTARSRSSIRSQPRRTRSIGKAAAAPSWNGATTPAGDMTSGSQTSATRGARASSRCSANTTRAWTIPPA
ncbi:MAG: hypothetical protein IJM21_07000 [Clostridia bacterium]|nr:hypothetical protein [Clostridia bacterium]